MPLRQNRPQSRRPRTRPVGAYRRILVPVIGSEASEQAIDLACQLAAEHRASITVITVIELPAELPLDAHMIEEEADAKRVLSEAQAIGEAYGVSVITRIVRARMAGEAIVEQASRSEAEIVVLKAPCKRRSSQRTPIFGRTVNFVLKHAPCRVMVAAESADASD